MRSNQPISLAEYRAEVGNAVNSLEKDLPSFYGELKKASGGEVFWDWQPLAPVVLESLLTKPDQGTRAAAISLLGQFGPPHDESAVTKLLKLSEDKHFETRLTAVLCLQQSNLHGVTDAVPTLLKAMQDDHAEIRRAAAGAWRKLDLDLASEGVSELVNRLQDSDTGVRIEALDTLAWLGPEAKGAMVSIIKVITKDGDTAFRIAAVHALLAVDPKGDSSTKTLSDYITNSAQFENVVQTLRGAGPRARGLRNRLQEAKVQLQPPFQANGPETPGSFWWQGKQYDIEPIPCKLLCQIWRLDKVEIAELAKAVWGGREPTQRQLSSALRKIMVVLALAEVPWGYGRSGKFVVKK